MYRRPFIGICFVFASLLQIGDLAATDLASQIPDNAIAYVVTGDLPRASRAVERVIELLELPKVDLRQMIQQQLALPEEIVNTDEIGLAIIADENRAPFPVLFIQTDDYAALLNQLAPNQSAEKINRVQLGGSDSLMSQKGTFAVFAPSSAGDAFEKTLERPGTRQNANGSKDFAQGAQAYAVVTESGVQLLMKQALGFIQMIKMRLSTAGPETETIAAGLAVYERLFQWSAKEVTCVTLALQVDQPGSIVLNKQVTLRNQVKFNQKSQAGSLTEQLDKLPDWPLVAAFAAKIDDTAPMQAWVEFSIEMMQTVYGSETALTDKQEAQLLELTEKSIEGVSGLCFTMGVPQPGKSIYDRMGMLMTVENPDQYLVNYMNSLQQMQEIFTDGKGMPYQIESTEKIMVGDANGLHVTIKMETQAFGPAAAQSQQMFNQLLGADGRIEFFAAPVDDHRVAFAYVSQQNLEEVMAAAKSPSAGLVSAKQLDVTASLLAEDAQGVGYLSPTGLLQYSQQVANLLMPGLQADAVPRIPPFPASPPLGFSLRYDGQTIDGEMAIPAPTLKALGAYIQTMRQSVSGNAKAAGD